MPDPIKLVKVTYTVNNQKVSFKAPEGTIFNGIDWKKGSMSGDPMNLDFKSEKSKGDVNLGEISEEKHKLLSAIRYADGNPELSTKDTKILTDLYYSRSNTKENDKYQNYINKNMKGMAKNDPNICSAPYINRGSANVYNPKTKTYHVVDVEIQDSSNIEGIFYNGSK